MSVFGAFLGAALGWLGTYLRFKWLEKQQLKLDQQPYNKLVGFNSAPILIVYPPRDYYELDKKKMHQKVFSFLPGTSTEDFLAINNVISVLVKLKREYKVRTWDRLTDLDVGDFNLILICSPKSNQKSHELQEILENDYKGAFIFEHYDEVGRELVNGSVVESTFSRYRIKSPSGGNYHSESYEQHERYVFDTPNPHVVPRVYNDLAVIAKVDNPWSKADRRYPEKKKAILISGIRGIGTWGAAECLKKTYDQLLEKYVEEGEPDNFSFLVRIEYQNADITDHEVKRCHAVEKKKS